MTTHPTDEVLDRPLRVFADDAKPNIWSMLVDILLDSSAQPAGHFLSVLLKSPVGAFGAEDVKEGE